MPSPTESRPGDRALVETFKRGMETQGDSTLLREITSLRKEIAELRRALAPVPSLILTGTRALEAFEKLSGEGSL